MVGILCFNDLNLGWILRVKLLVKNNNSVYSTIDTGIFLTSNVSLLYT